MGIFLDFMGTDGSDPSKVYKVYPDGTRVPLSDAASLTAKDAGYSSYTTARSALAARIASARQWIGSAQANDAAGLTAGADGYTTAEAKQVLDLLLNQMTTVLEIEDKLLAYLNFLVSS